jgi:hypothetical protein
VKQIIRIQQAESAPAPEYSGAGAFLMPGERKSRKLSQIKHYIRVIHMISLEL